MTHCLTVAGELVYNPKEYKVVPSLAKDHDVPEPARLRHSEAFFLLEDESHD
jgi:hypothetical protein